MVAVVLRLVFGKPGQIAAALGLLWVLAKDPGGVASGALQWVSNLLVENLKDAVLPAGS